MGIRGSHSLVRQDTADFEVYILSSMLEFLDYILDISKKRIHK